MENKIITQKILIHPITRIILGLLGQELRNLVKGIFASAAVIITYLDYCKQ